MDQPVSITNRARQCIRLFEQCPEPVADAWADDQCAQFKIWASNLGIFARGHASIDYRLGPLGCHDRKSYRLISQLIDGVFENLRIGKQTWYRSLWLWQLVLIAILANAVSQLSRASEAFADCGASHHLDLEDIIARNEDGQWDRSSSASSGIEDLPVESTPAQRLRHACIEVEDLISRLNMITLTVRRAGARYREEKAQRFKDVVKLTMRRDEEATETEVAAQTETGVKPKGKLELNRTEQFASLMAARINHMFPAAEEWLRSRLASAIALRRNYLAYLEQQQQRLMQSYDSDFDEDDGFSEDPSAESLASEIAASDSGPCVPGYPGRIAPSQAASGKAQSEASTISFNWQACNLHIPLPQSVFEDVFRCPYCHVLCDVQESQGDRWM
jgi:hypothetical protein